jgi:hypothetical protein
MIRARKLCLNKERTENVPIFICQPNQEDEQCPITAENIGSPSYTPPYCEGLDEPRSDGPKAKKTKFEPKKNVPLFSDFPTLTCAEMLCGHRFDARALLIHFVRNSMSCPMCRGGVSSSTLSCKASFPNEKWLCNVEERILSEMQREEDTQRNEDAMLAGNLQTMYYYHFNLPSLIHNTLQDQRINASLLFYDTPIPVRDDVRLHQEAIHGMLFELEMMPLEIRQRDLSRGISLYTSFSSNSITTPPSQQESDVNLDNINNPDANHEERRDPRDDDDNNNMNNVNIHYLINNNINDIRINQNHNNELLSFDDFTVRYVMSEATLRYPLNLMDDASTPPDAGP